MALIAFSALTLVALNGAQREALDAQLATIARGILAIVDDRNGRASLDADDLGQFRSVVGAKASSAIFGRDGQLVASTGGSIPVPVRAAALASSAGTLVTESDGRDAVRVFAAPIARVEGRIGSIAVWRDAGDIEALDWRVGYAFALAIPFVAAIAIALGSEIARRGLRDVDRIATLASEIEANDLGRRLSFPQRGDELGRLAATFDRMLDRLQGAFARERRFTSDASHELRAPLSVIRAEADVALRKERDTSEYRRALSVIVEEADALEHLTRELLAAARADAPTGTDAAAILTEVVHSVGARMHKVAQERQITICVTEHTEGEVFVSADRATLERAIVPIVHNAIMHAREVVELSVERDGDFEALRVSDDGAGFSESGLERAFERFWRDDDARRRAGTGLGMPIARTLILASGGTIEIANRPGGGASVHIRIPHALFSKSPTIA